LAACQTTSSNSTEKEFDIPGYGEAQKNPFADTANHKAGDVEIFRLLGKDTTYVARLYRMDHGEKRNYETVIVENINYDKASFHWMNDSTIAFSLIDSKHKQRKGFRLTGSAGTTTVEDIN
jgi:hypothetical protein